MDEHGWTRIGIRVVFSALVIAAGTVAVLALDAIG